MARPRDRDNNNEFAEGVRQALERQLIPELANIVLDYGLRRDPYHLFPEQEVIQLARLADNEELRNATTLEPVVRMIETPYVRRLPEEIGWRDSVILREAKWMLQFEDRGLWETFRADNREWFYAFFVSERLPYLMGRLVHDLQREKFMFEALKLYIDRHSPPAEEQARLFSWLPLAKGEELFIGALDNTPYLLDMSVVERIAEAPHIQCVYLDDVALPPGALEVLAYTQVEGGRAMRVFNSFEEFPLSVLAECARPNPVVGTLNLRIERESMATALGVDVPEVTREAAEELVRQIVSDDWDVQWESTPTTFWVILSRRD